MKKFQDAKSFRYGTQPSSLKAICFYSFCSPATPPPPPLYKQLQCSPACFFLPSANWEPRKCAENQKITPITKINYLKWYNSFMRSLSPIITACPDVSTFTSKHLPTTSPKRALYAHVLNRYVRNFNEWTIKSEEAYWLHVEWKWSHGKNPNSVNENSRKSPLDEVSWQNVPIKEKMRITVHTEMHNSAQHILTVCRFRIKYLKDSKAVYKAIKATAIIKATRCRKPKMNHQ